MKNEAQRARRARMTAANRLIKHIHTDAHQPEDIVPAPPVKEIVRRMVRPMEVHVKVVPA